MIKKVGPEVRQPRISMGLLRRMIGEKETQQSESSHERVLERVASALFTAGAERVRYYQIAREVVPGLDQRETLFLTWESSLGTVSRDEHIGLRIALENASIFRSLVAGSGDPIQESAGEADRHWVDLLDLWGKSWVDVLVTRNGVPNGLLAFDWTGGRIPWEVRDRQILRLLGDILGVQLAATSPAMERILENSLRGLYLAESEGERLVRRALVEFQEAVGVASIALFRHDWTTESLRREFFRLHSSQSFDQSFSEQPIPCGKYLTGKAWAEAEYRCVLDVTRMESSRPDLVSRDSMSYHNLALGHIGSAMYSVLGAREPKWLIRAINDSTHPDLPFIRKYGILKEFARDLSPLLEADRAAKQATALNQFQDARMIGRKLEDVCSLVEDALEGIEGIPRIVIAVRRESSSASNKPYFLWNVPKGKELELAQRLEADNQWAEISAGNEPLVLRRQNSGQIGAVMGASAQEGADVAVMPRAFGGSRVVLLFPVWGDGRTRLRDRRLWSPETEHFLRQMTLTLAQIAERKYTETQAEGALQALALVGHEMSEPLSAVRQLGLHSIRSVKKSVSGSDPIPIAKLSNWEQRFEHDAQVLESAVRLGQLVGRQLDGQLIGVYKRDRQVLSILYAACSRVYDEIRARTLLSPLGGIRIAPAKGDRTARMAGDELMLETAIANILRNAVKYSVSDGGRANVTTEIHSHNDRDGVPYVSISIENLGLSIDPTRVQLIFDAFQRGVQEDHTEISRRGMGLGLFLARQIARAHGGDVSLDHHRLDSRSSLYSTRFTIRFRSDLPPGPYSRKLE